MNNPKNQKQIRTKLFAAIKFAAYHFAAGDRSKSRIEASWVGSKMCSKVYHDPSNGDARFSVYGKYPRSFSEIDWDAATFWVDAPLP